MTLEYNGCQYEIIQNEDDGGVENIASEDEYENDYESDIEKKVALLDGFRESPWEPDSVNLFLDECIKRKASLHNPKIRRRNVFAEIRKRLKEKGYFFKIESLDRKLRNMKIHYLTTRANNKKSRRVIHWAYYSKMKIIYPDKMTRESYSRRKGTAQNLDSYDQLPADEASSASSPSSHVSAPASPPTYKTEYLSETPECAEGSDEISQFYTCNFSDHPNKMERLRKQIFYLEERRTIAAEKILNELRESNRLKRELLDLNIKKFNVQQLLIEE